MASKNRYKAPVKLSHACGKSQAQAPAYDLALLEQDRAKCPLEYERQSFEDVRDYKAWPYLLGGFAKPVCHNCGQDNLWSHFCQYQCGTFLQATKLPWMSQELPRAVLMML